MIRRQDVMIEERRKMSPYQAPLEGDASPARSRHLITFGHPYSCTPLLNAIFEFNRSPSHSEVTKIMKQTGLKRKQLTSWFWRKRKELSDPQPSGSNFGSRSSRPQSPDVLGPPKNRVIKPSLPKAKGYNKTTSEEEDDDYRPPGHPVIPKSCDSRGRMSPRATRNRSASIMDLRTRNSPLEEHPAQTKPHVHNSHHHLQSVLCASSSDREPLLVRCRLRPPTERILSETIEANQDGPQESTEIEQIGNSPTELPVQSSNTNLNHKDSDGNLPLENLSSNSPMPQSSSKNSDTSESSRMPTANDIILPDASELPPDLVPITVPCRRESDPHNFQLDFETMSGSREQAISTTRRLGSRKTSWLTSEERLGCSHNNAAQTTSRGNSTKFCNSSYSSVPNTSNSMETSESIFWRVSQEEPDVCITSNTNLGQEIHRWSEISNIDCASRYSSESIDTRESFCTNAAVEDYSALLSTSPTQIPLCESPTPQPGCSTENDFARNGYDLRKDSGMHNFANGVRYASNTYRPSEQSNRTLSHQDEKELFNPNASLLKDSSGIEDDSSLFMWEQHHQEFLNLMDWNPLGSFINNKC